MVLLLIIFFLTIFLLFFIFGSKDNLQPKIENKKPKVKEINPVRELYSLTVHADDGIKPPSASKGNDRRLKSAVFSNGIKIPPEAESETLRVKLRKLKEDNQALEEELKTAKNNEVLAKEETGKVKGWLEKDRNLEESVKKELYEFKDKLLKKDQEFDQEFSRTIALKKELSDYKQRYESLEIDNRESREKLRILETQNTNLKEELKDLTRSLAEFKKEKQESQWVSKKEYDELKAHLIQKERFSGESKEQS